ncbi:glycosyltransferase family protein [Clostridium magnum]|uniref:Spore protein YkvP n=1 Tax=Clostridium magnum DSM 2767 TaxID=1121326 RepID=A0A162U9L5_9CLOT|nr:glycosyltransferase [Clostridium magnum]KZL93674.1 spore protein YkvP [Clostridium magnum DSM 2767]SHI92715.1 Spore maturation protein CgeB [Clostridium magnum DSM 2767]
MVEDNYDKKELPVLLSQETNKKKSRIKVACILDVFSYECLKYECNLIQLYSDSWKNILLQEKPDLLLVESAWKGIDESWRKKVGYLAKSQDRTLEKLVKFCKYLKIPTVFWNKEDPYHFELFLPAAKLFEYIFTTDVNCISRYKELLGHKNVYVLPFGAQPKIHNPVGKDKEKLGYVAFAGTWYNNGHLNRKRNMENVLKPALIYGLQIYDRNYNYTVSESYRFPDIFRSCNRGCIPYEEMYQTYKKYNVFLNVNSMDDSPTMFSRRVFELLACGTNVISSYSLGIKNMFSKIVKLSMSEEETLKHLESLLRNKELRDRLSLQGQREVFNKHTYTHRFESMLDKVGILYKKQSSPSVSIITCTNRCDSVNNVFLNYERQKYENKELIIILNNNSMNLDTWEKKASMHKDVKIFRLDEEKSLGECLNYAISKSSFDYVARFDDDNYYASEFIGDMMNAFKYTDADIVGKHTYYAYLEKSKTLVIRFPDLENQYVKFLCGSTTIIRKAVLDQVEFTGKSEGCDTDFLKRCIQKNIKLYSTDRFNYVYIRHSSSNDHTWKIKDEEFLNKCKIIECVDDYRQITTV